LTSHLDIFRTASVLIREHGEEAGVERGLTTILTANVVGYPQIRPHALARLRRLA
jgi:hypothetical protein